MANPPRIFQDIDLQLNAVVVIDVNASHHLIHVLRVNVNDFVTLFTGKGGEYSAQIVEIKKKNIIVQVKSFLPRNVESPLELYLAQGISRSDKMDFTIQKAVEMGVKKIFPMVTERCKVKFDQNHLEKKFQHWRSVIVSACEQSGRNTLPLLERPQLLSHWMTSVAIPQRLILSPHAEQTLQRAHLERTLPLVLLVGPESGFSEQEFAAATSAQFLSFHLGPRILRTETAGLVAITMCQTLWGDLSF